MEEPLEIAMDTVTTRSFVKGTARAAREESTVLDLSQVEMISRAAADQLIIEVEEHDTRVVMSDAVRRMVEAIYGGEFLHESEDDTSE